MRSLIRPFKLADRCVTNAEWIAFIEDGGYATPTLWLADGWATVKAQGWTAPLYWEEADGGFMQMSLLGFRPRRSCRARLPCQLLRGRCLCALGRLPAAHPNSNGRWPRASLPVEGRTLGASHLAPLRAEAGGPRPQADVWRCVGVDGKRLSSLPRLQGGARRGRRVQRQVHVQSVRAARRLLRHAAKGISARPTAISSIPISAGSSWACGWPATPDGARHPAHHRRRPRALFEPPVPEARSARRPILPTPCWRGSRTKPRSLPCRFFYDARGCGAVRGDHPASGILPDAGRDGAARGLWRRDRRGAWAMPACWSSSAQARAARRACLSSALPRVAVYVPIDVAGESLAEAAEWLAERHDGLAIRPLVADFTKTRTLPIVARRPQKLGFFSGSTIGNLTHAEAHRFSRQCRAPARAEARRSSSAST